MVIISLTTQLVYKVPLIITPIDFDKTHYIIRTLSIEDIENDEWLKKDKESLIKLIKKGHIGVIIFDKEKQKAAARSFMALYPKRPNHIPKIPKNSAWLHFGAVKEEYRGHGLLKNLIMFSIQFIRKIDDKVDIYTDTGKDNIPSRINQIRLGLIECGVFTVFKIGTQRYPLSCIQLGFWNKKTKHPELSIDPFKSNRNVSTPTKTNL